MYTAEREPWRHDAELQCVATGMVKEGAGITRRQPIRVPGVCGADFPLKLAILGGRAPLCYMDDLRRPGAIPRAAPRWPLRPAGPPAEPSYQSRVLPDDQVRSPQGRQGAPDQPISLSPPGVTEGPNVAAEPYDFRRPYGVAPAPVPPKYSSPAAVGSRREEFSPEPYDRRPLMDAPATLRNGATAITRGPLPEPRAPPAPTSARASRPPLGPSRDGAGSFTPVGLSPPAPLACPIVSAL